MSSSDVVVMVNDQNQTRSSSDVTKKPFDWRSLALVSLVGMIVLAIVLALTLSHVIDARGSSSSSNSDVATKPGGSLATPDAVTSGAILSESTPDDTTIESDAGSVNSDEVITVPPPAGATEDSLMNDTPATGEARVVVSAAAATTGRHLYVAPSGAQYTTITAASAAAKPGDIIHVAPGKYYGGIKTTKSGTATARIVYISDTQWGAKLVPGTSTSVGAIWTDLGDYVDIIGFQVDGTGGTTNWVVGLYLGGSHSSIQKSWVHNLGQKAPLNSKGGSGVAADAYYKGVDNHLIGNIVHDLGPTTGKFIQGVYMSTSGSVRDNLAYNVQQWCIHLWHNANNVLVSNNTAHNCYTGGGFVIGGGDFYNGYTAGADYVKVTGNTAYGSPYGITEYGKIGTHNTYINNKVYNNQINWKLSSYSHHYEGVPV